jgi:Fe-S cluster assembly protein SufD
MKTKHLWRYLDEQIFLEQKVPVQDKNIVVSENEVLELTDEFDGQATLHICITLKENATLKYVQKTTECKMPQFIKTVIECEKGSQLDFGVIAINSELIRNEIEINLRDEGSSCNVLGFAKLYQKQRLHNHIYINHHVPNCESNQEFRHIQHDQSVTEFNSGIYVEKNAIQTKADQKSISMLLSNEARSLASPKLKIYADDVECSHSASIKLIEEEELFYLQSRGLTEDQAKSSLIEGFETEILDLIS